MCLCVCLRPLFLDNHWSDVIETCHVYCWGPVDVPFQGLILIGQVVPKLWPFIYQTNDVTIDVTIVLLFFSLFFFFARTATHVRARTSNNKNRTAHPEAHLDQDQQSLKPPTDLLRP